MPSNIWRRNPSKRLRAQNLYKALLGGAAQDVADDFFEPSEAGAQTISNAGGIMSGEACGAITLQLWLAALGLSSVEALGTGQVKLGVNPTGIVSQEGWGIPSLGLSLQGGAIQSGEVVGQAGLNLAVLALGIASGDGIGEPSLGLVLRPMSMTSMEVVGNAACSLGVSTNGIPSEEAIGHAKLQGSQVRRRRAAYCGDVWMRERRV